MEQAADVETLGGVAGRDLAVGGQRIDHRGQRRGEQGQQRIDRMRRAVAAASGSYPTRAGAAWAATAEVMAAASFPRASRPSGQGSIAALDG